MRALLVDDERDICEILDFKLKSLGFHSDFAHSGNEAIELCNTNNYQLIISDIRMPQGSGIDLIDSLKSKKSQLPAIIFLTGHTEVSESELLDLGVLAILEKPIDFERLIKCVKDNIITPKNGAL